MLLHNNSLLIIAAETSACSYASQILDQWKNENFNLECFGIGNQEMKTHGFDVLVDSHEMSFMGITEVLKNYFKIKKVFKLILNEVEKRNTKVALLIDYPGFNLRIAKELKKRNVKVLYYISPQLWAWREKRVETVKKYIDKMFVLFPFEKEFYKKHGFEVEFVGHPIISEIKPLDSNMLREKCGIERNQFVIGLMPGSRKNEIHHCLKTQIQTANILYNKFPYITFVLMIAPDLIKEEVVTQLGEYSFPLIIVKQHPTEMISMADLILCTSGTATLMVGLLEKPMVIMYKSNSLSVYIGKKVLLIKNFGLPNIILGEEVFPEFLQESATPENLSHSLEKFILDKSYYEEKKKKLLELKDKLSLKNATLEVSNFTKSYFI